MQFVATILNCRNPTSGLPVLLREARAQCRTLEVGRESHEETAGDSGGEELKMAASVVEPVAATKQRSKTSVRSTMREERYGGVASGLPILPSDSGRT